MGNGRLAHFDEWEAELRAELKRLLKQRGEVETELQRLSKKLELVKQMRALERAPSGDERVTAATSERPEPRATPQDVKETVRKILLESARPLHISEIHRRFVEAGHPIPGGGTPFNILAHIVNDKAFVRVARGTYALAGSVPQEQVIPKSPRKKKKRKLGKRSVQST